MPGWMKHKLESRLQGEIPITSDMQTTCTEESEEELKSLLMKVTEESKKADKYQHSNKKYHGICSYDFMASVLPVNIQDWFPLGWTGWVFLLSKGLSRVFSNTIGLFTC